MTIANAVRRYDVKNGRQLIVRRANSADAEALLEYLEQVSGETDFLSFGSGEFGRSLSEEAEFIQRTRCSDNGLYIVGTIDEKIVGALSFAGGKRCRTRHSGEFGMSVAKNCWRLGIGSLLLDTLIKWANKSDVVTKLNLRVRTDNERAISLYQRKGFVIEGTIHKDFLINGKYFDHYCMGLEL